MNKIKFTRTNVEEILKLCMSKSYGAYLEYDNKENKMILNLEKMGRLCAKVVEGQELEYTDNRIQIHEDKGNE